MACLSAKHNCSAKMRIFNVFSSRFYVEKHVLTPKKVQKSTRKCKVIFEIRFYRYTEGALCPHLYPYAPDQRGPTTWSTKICQSIGKLWRDSGRCRLTLNTP